MFDSSRTTPPVEYLSGQSGHNFLWIRRNTPEVSKSFVAKKWKEKNWSPLPFKVGNDLFVRSIGETRSDLKRDQMCTNIQHWADYHQKWKKEIFSGTIRMLPMSPYYIYLHFEWTHICHMGPFRTQAFEHCYDGYWWERELPYLRNRLNSQLRTGGQGRAYNTMWKNTIVNYAWNTKGNSQYFHQWITE